MTEVVIARINMFLQHYRTPSTLGTKLQMSLEALQLEAGYRDCVLNHPYYPQGPLTTHCWCRSFWESIDHYGFKMTIDYPETPFPRVNDRLLIDVLESQSPSGDTRRSFQRCRRAWKSLFLSDVAQLTGRGWTASIWCLHPVLIPRNQPTPSGWRSPVRRIGRHGKSFGPGSRERASRSRHH